MGKEIFFNDFLYGGELFLVNLEVAGSLDYTCMQIIKNNIANQKRTNNQAYYKVT